KACACLFPAATRSRFPSARSLKPDLNRQDAKVPGAASLGDLGVLAVNILVMSDERAAAIEAFIGALPDPQGARAFWERLQAVRKIDYQRDSLLASRLLTIAAYSPFLAEDLLRHP